MNITAIRTAAEEFGIPFKAAVWTRCRFIKGRLQQFVNDMDQYEVFVNGSVPWTSEILTIQQRLLTLDEITSLGKELRMLTGLVNGHDRKQQITGEQIAAARATPISEVVQFTRGKARAWCHDDRNPSLYHGTRNNIAVCPVCDRKFGPIDVLMTRDGLDFISAVRSLI